MEPIPEHVDRKVPERLMRFEWFPKCPDGHRWWSCAHEELASKPIGFGIMVAGAWLIALGIVEKLA